jgi:hypothetical protein
MIRGLAAPSIGYRKAQTSARLAAQAVSKATVSVTCTRSQEVLRIVFMTGKTSGDSTRGVSHDIFSGIQDSLKTQGRPVGYGALTPNRVLNVVPANAGTHTLRPIGFPNDVGHLV